MADVKQQGHEGLDNCMQIKKGNVGEKGCRDVPGERSPCSLTGGSSSSWPTGAGQGNSVNSLISNRGGGVGVERRARKQQMGFYNVHQTRQVTEKRWWLRSETKHQRRVLMWGRMSEQDARGRRGRRERGAPLRAEVRGCMCGDDIAVVSTNVVNSTSCQEEQ